MNDYDGTVVIGTELDTSGFEKGLKDIKNTDVEENVNVIDDKQPNIFKKVLNYTGRIGRKFLGITASSAKFLLNIGKIVASLGAVGALIGVVGLALFGIGKAFQKAIEKNDELRTKIEYLKFVISEGFSKLFASVGQGLVKVIDWLVERLLNIVALIGLIVKKLFKVDMFSEATADNFAKTQKSAGALKKTLAGFDEMEILGDSGGLGVADDIALALDGMKTMEERMDDVGKKIRKFLFGGDTFKEGMENYNRHVKEVFGSTVKWLDENYFSKIRELWAGVVELLRPMWEPVANAFHSTIENIKKEAEPIVKWLEENLVNPIKELWEGFKKSFIDMFAPFINWIIDIINRTFGVFGVHLDYIETKSEETGDGIKENIGGALDETKEKAEELSGPEYKIKIGTDEIDLSKNWVEDLLDKLKELTGKAWNIITNFTTNGLSRNTMNSWLQPLRDKLGKMGINLPYLAKGGIINMPSRGVPVGSAIVGERGAEGVIPLTDSQQMELLGQAIGKYITVAPTIPVYVGNRLVAREIKKINAEDNFAYNK